MINDKKKKKIPCLSNGRTVQCDANIWEQFLKEVILDRPSIDEDRNLDQIFIIMILILITLYENATLIT